MVSEARNVEFNALPEFTRQRFVAATRQAAEPKPLYINETPTADGAAKGIFAAIAGVVTLGFLLVSGFGESTNEDLAFLWIAGGVALVVGLLVAARAKLLRKRVPFVEGTYLFPLDLVIARAEQLTIIPLAGLSNVHAYKRQDGGVELRLLFAAGNTPTLLVENQQRAERLVAQLHAERARFAAAAAVTGDMSLFARQDSFYEARTSGEWDVICAAKGVAPSGSPSVGRVPFWARRLELIGGTVGFLLGFSVSIARNMASDDMMFERAEREMTVASLNKYLGNGGTSHADEVRKVLLPRAELTEVKSKNSVSALREYRERYPDGPHDEEAREAIHALFVAAIEKFEAQAKGKNPQLLEHMRAMFAWLEIHDSPPVEIRFRAPDAEALREVDTKLVAIAQEVGLAEIVAISPSFTPEMSAQREGWIHLQLGQGFADVVPSDILELVPGEPLPFELDIAELRPTRATIAVSYIIGASGSIYTGEAKTRGYVGIIVGFVVTMLVPETEGHEAPPPLSFMLVVEPPAEFTVHSQGTEITDYEIYNVMARKAFEKLDAELRGAFFAAGDGEGLELISGKIPELTLEPEAAPEP
jgi:hypothetical protein